jgi:aminoglycoside phosphotransferase (APT) family kinase protein
VSLEIEVSELHGRATAALAQRWPGARLSELEPLPGGISSLTFASWLDQAPGQAGGQARPVVVKVAPPGLAPVRNRDVLRQARLMRALADVPGVRVPDVLAEQDGAPPLFVMEFVTGEAYEPHWDAAASPPAPAVVQRRALAATAMLAHLHGPAPESVGLGDEPVLSCRQELERWGQLYATVGDDLRGQERRLLEALAARWPAPAAPRVTHGDYRLGNLQFAGDELRAIIDWELWSVGDPRTDLAWLVVFGDPVLERVAGRDAGNQAAAMAMPSRDGLVDAYERVRPDASSELDWFVAYGYYKLASTMAALAKRNRRAVQPDPTLERAAQTLAPTIERGLEVLAQRGRAR